MCEREAACTWVSTAIGALKALKCRGSASDETGSVNVTGKVYDVIKGGTQISANSDNRLMCWAYSALQRLVSTWIYNSVASSHKTGYKLHRVPLTDWLPSVSAHHWWVLPETRPTCGLSPTESFVPCPSGGGYQNLWSCFLSPRRYDELDRYYQY